MSQNLELLPLSPGDHVMHENDARCHCELRQATPLSALHFFSTAKLKQHKQGISLGRTVMLGSDKINRLGFRYMLVLYLSVGQET